jgi:hypothetical protein
MFIQQLRNSVNGRGCSTERWLATFVVADVRDDDQLAGVPRGDIVTTQ